MPHTSSVCPADSVFVSPTNRTKQRRRRYVPGTNCVDPVSRRRVIERKHQRTPEKVFQRTLPASEPDMPMPRPYKMVARDPWTSIGRAEDVRTHGATMDRLCRHYSAGDPAPASVVARGAAAMRDGTVVCAPRPPLPRQHPG